MVISRREEEGKDREGMEGGGSSVQAKEQRKGRARRE